jgi:hypothetical protein
MDLMPLYEGIFLPQKGTRNPTKIELETLTRTNPQPDESIKNPYTRRQYRRL